MPLKKGSGKFTISNNIKELIHAYKEKGKIGNTTPKNMKHAREIASAIAYEKAGKQKSAKVEALESFIMSLSDENNTLIENVIMEAFDVCFNSAIIEDATQTTTSSTNPSAPTDKMAVVDPAKLTPEQMNLVAAQAKVVADQKTAQQAVQTKTADEEKKLQALSAPPTTPASTTPAPTTNT